ncbi:MAG: hypothetical protein M5T52_08220 [Ignavibacteriaceae bacterium]|nr:hypothetical protein [Ignavibacteriaceae bacterium]
MWLGYSKLLEDFLSNYFSNQYLLLLAFLLFVGIVGSVISFPITYYTGFYLEHKYNLSNQTFWKWIWENFKGLLVSLAIGVPILLTFYYILHTFYSFWWLPFAIIMFFISVVLSQIFPVLIFPIFYKVTPVENESLKERIQKACLECEVESRECLQIQYEQEYKKGKRCFYRIGKNKKNNPWRHSS